MLGCVSSVKSFYKLDNALPLSCAFQNDRNVLNLWKKKLASRP